MVQKKKQLAHLFDATQCISCGACILACSQTNFPEMHNKSIPGRNWPASNIVFSVPKREVPLICWFSASSVKTHLVLRLVRSVRTTTTKTA